MFSSSEINGLQKGAARDIAAKEARVGHDIVQGAMDGKKAKPGEFERIKRSEITVGAARRKLAWRRHLRVHSPPLKGTAAFLEGTNR